MRDITFKVNQQRIKNINSVAFVYGGTDNYLNLVFEFDSNWNGCKKVISFVVGDKELPFLLKNNSYPVPKEAFNSNELTFYLVGKKDNYRIESQKFTIKLTED